MSNTCESAIQEALGLGSRSSITVFIIVKKEIMDKLKLAFQYLLAIFFILAGANHFLNADFYLKMMPPYLPWHLFLVYLSGVFEIILGIMVIIPKLNRIAGWGLIALLIAVFPANLHMALNPDLFPNISSIALWIRLPLQAVLIAWAYWYTT